MSGMIRDSDHVVAFWRAPFAEGVSCKVPFTAGGTLADMVVAMEFMPPDFDRRGNILIAGHKIDRRNWRRIKPKPGVEATFHYPLGGGSSATGSGKSNKNGVLGLVIAVAAIAASVFTLGGGFAFLGGSTGLFGAGTLSAKILAGAIGLASALAQSALSAPPVRPTTPFYQTKGPASATGNLLGAGAPIPRVIGTRKVFPQLAAQPLTYRIGDDEFVEAVFALAGPHDLQSIKVGDTLISNSQDVTYQVRNGWSDDAPIDLVTRYGVTKQPGIELSAPDVQSDAQDTLVNQVSPTISLPRQHAVGAASAPDHILIDLILSSGLYDQSDSTRRLSIPIRITLTDSVSGVSFKLPEFHYTSKLTREIKPTIELVWRAQTVPIPNSMPAQEGWTSVLTSVPAQASPPMGGWASDPSFYAGSGPTYLVNGIEAASGVARCYATGQKMIVEIDANAIPKSRYQVQIIRGETIKFSNFSNDSNYTYNGTVQDFFGYVLSGTTAKILESRANFSDRMGFVRLTSIYDKHPIAGGLQGPGLALIAVVAKNRAVSDLSVVASGYIKDWDGAGWNTWTTTSNPVPHFYDVLRGQLTPDPIDLALIDNSSLTDWRTSCIANSYTCDMICEGDAIDTVLNRIAGCGYARPRMSETWGVTRDYDRSAQDPVQVFTSRNSSGISMAKAFPRLPDAFRAIYVDADGADQQSMVYRPGYVGTINPRIEEVRYDGFKTATATNKRALFDLVQADLRGAFFSFSAPAEALVATRGDLIAVNHDAIDQNHASARIVDVEILNGSITAITVDSVVPVFNELPWESVVAVEAVTAVENIGAVSSVGIRHADSLETIHALSGVSGAVSRLVFATSIPVVLADDGFPVIRYDNLVWLGIGTTKIAQRLIVFGVEYDANQMAKITAVNEAPTLWTL